MKNFKHAFTMIELIFVIVILGILAAIAFPKLSGVTRDANLAQGMATVAAVRSAIASERQKNLIKGSGANYPDYLDDAAANTDDEKLFDGNGTTVSILQYPIYSSTDQGGWRKTSANGATTTYDFYIDSSTQVEFEYKNGTIGTFDCDHTDSDCKEMISH